MRKTGRKTDAEKLLNTIRVDQRPTQSDFDLAKKALPYAVKMGLSKEVEQEIFLRVSPELAMLGRLQMPFMDTIVNYCRLVARIRINTEILDDVGATYQVGELIKPHPLLTQLNTDTRVLRHLTNDLGLSPASTSTVSSDLQNGKSDDFDGF